MHLPVRRLAADLVAPNSVSKYFGRNTTKPLTIDTSQQMPKHVTMYTGFVTRRQTDDGKSTSKQRYKTMITTTARHASLQYTRQNHRQVFKFLKT